MKIIEGVHAFFWKSMSANNCNTYLLRGDSSCVLIDPGHLRLFDHVETALEQASLRMEDMDLVLVSHFHPDHIEGAKLFKEKGIPFAVHHMDWETMTSLGRHMGAGVNTSSWEPDFFLEEGDLQVKDLSLQIIHTPGHSPGSVSIYWPGKKVLATGDVLFRDGLGRTDLPGGSGSVLKESIRKLSTYDVELLLPGHGDAVSGKENVERNFKRVEEFWFAHI